MKKIFIVTIFLLLISTLSFAAADSAPSIKTSINKKRVFIGDRVRYKIEISSPHTLEIEFPVFKDGKMGDVEIKDSGSMVKKSLFGRRIVYTKWFDIASYYTMRRKIPPIEIKYRENKKGDWNTLKTTELSFTVESVLPSGVKLYDIKDIKGLVYFFSPLKLLIWIITGLIIIWLIFKLIKKLKKMAPQKKPHEIALEELEAARKQLAASGDAKEYYVRISDVIRRYIEIMFSLRAPEMTTQEFLLSLGNSPKLAGAHRELLKDFMEACDLVKFAKHTPAGTEIEGVFTTAKKFIEETKDINVHI